VYNDVVRLDDLERLIDCSFVQVMHGHVPVLLLLRACSVRIVESVLTADGVLSCMHAALHDQQCQGDLPQAAAAVQALQGLWQRLLDL